MLDHFRDLPRQAAHAVFRGFVPKLATSALTTFMVSAMFAQLAPERPVPTLQTALHAAPEINPVPVERLWPREPDLARVFSFSLDTAGQPFSSLTPPPASASIADAHPSDAAQAAPVKASMAANPDPTSGAPAKKAPAKLTFSKPRAAQTTATVMPPARPAATDSVPARVAAEPAAAPEPKPEGLLGVTLPGWVPTGRTVVTTVSALGDAVRNRLSF